VDVQGAPSIAEVELRRLIDPFEGRCLGLAEFDAVLEAVTLAYVDRGLILSRAYLPEQDLTSGTLEIRVVEGALSAIVINGTERPRWAGMVFPGLVGAPVDIRAIEQGLDQIEAMPRWSAELAFAPTDTPGETVLNVTADTPKRTAFRYSSNNRGSKQTGTWISALSVDTTNLLGLNDTWRASISKSLNPNPFALYYDGDTNRAASFGVSLPYGRWSVDYDFSFSDYALTIPGAIDLIDTDGFVRTQTLTAEYLYQRDQTTKHVFGATLRRAENQNFIQDVRIEASSRVLTGLRLSYGRSNPLWAGAFEGKLYAERGLRAFGGEDGADLPDGSPDPQYFLAGFDASYAQALGATGTVNWTATMQGQHSGDRLYGSQAFAIGGVSTVRGSKTSLASGSSGIVLRNEVDYRFLQGKPYADVGSFYTAIDYGHVLSQDALGISAAHALGGVVGLKMSGGGYNFDVSYQEVFSVTQGLARPAGGVFATFELIF
jgi:hemolysin activation/secretion protein